MQGWRWVMVAVVASGVGLTSAPPVCAQSSPVSRAEAVSRASALVGETYDLVDKGPHLDACAGLLEPWLDDATRNYRQIDDAYPFVLAQCRYGDTGTSGPRINEPALRAWIMPWREAVRRSEPTDPLWETKWLFVYVHYARSIGLSADADRLMLDAVATRIERMRSSPDDPQPGKELAYLASMTFGSWDLQDQVRRMHALYEQGLGPGHRSTLAILRSLAYHERFLGRPTQALTYIERAVALARDHQPNDAMLSAHMATEHAACLSAAGRLVEARRRMLDARTVFAIQQPSQDLNLSRIDVNLAGMALAMADFDAAIAHANDSIEHAHRSGDPSRNVEAMVPRSIREVARLHKGEADAAMRLREVLSETRTEMHIGPQAFALVEHAARTGDRAMQAWATDFTDLHIRQFRTPLQSDAALRPLMQAWRSGGYGLEADSVREHLDRALAISLSGRSLGTLALTYFSLARHMLARDPDSAVWLYKRGANALQAMRSGLPEGEPALHRAWLGSHEADLRSFIGLLIDQGRLVEAEQALRALRDEESHEYSRRSNDGRGTPIEALSFTKGEALRNVGMDAIVASAEQAAKEADVKVDAIGRRGPRTTYRDLQAQARIDELTLRVRQVVDEVPSATRGLPIQQPDRGGLRRGSARLTYFVRDDRVDIVLQMANGLRRTSVPIAKAELNRTIQAARAALATPQKDALQTLQTLHTTLLAPVRPALRRAGIRRLQWVPDAALRYVPFAALHDGQRYVAQDYIVTTRWAGSTGTTARSTVTRGPSHPTQHVIGLGRTLGDNEHSALPGVGEELLALRRVGARVWTDHEFTAQRLQTEMALRPGIVHLASHFVLDPAGEDKSYLLLGDGQRMPLTALSALPWQGVKLALLSACDSGVSVDAGPGQALVGFASSLQRAGVDNVLATLWRVSDDATAQWMRLFYRAAAPVGVAKRPVRVDAQSAAVAQRQWLRAHAGTALVHPHYWGGFVWITTE